MDVASRPHGEDDQDADLDAQLYSPGNASPQSSGDGRDAFLRHSGDASHSIKFISKTTRTSATSIRGMLSL